MDSVTTTQIDLNAIAFDNVYAAPRGTAIPGYFPLAQPTAESFKVGQVVAIHSRGNERLAVIEKVGRVKVTVIYVTEGGIKEATKYWEHYSSLTDAKIQAFVHAEERFARENWDYLATQTHNADQRAKFLAEYPDRAVYASSAGEKKRAGLVERRTQAQAKGVWPYVNVTRKSVAFGAVGVKV